VLFALDLKRFEKGGSEARARVRWTLAVPVCVSAHGNAPSESLLLRQKRALAKASALFN